MQRTVVSGGDRGNQCFIVHHIYSIAFGDRLVHPGEECRDRADRLPSATSPTYHKNAPQLAPDLAVDTVSETQYAPGMMAKAQIYLSFGTRLAWVIWSRYKRVDVRRPGDKETTQVGVEDVLDGEDVVPGFTYPIARLFR